MMIQDTFPFLKENSQKNRMLYLQNAWGIFRKFSWLYYLYLQIQNWWVLYIHEMLLVYRLETFKNYKEVKYIVIMIITIICIFSILCDISSAVENCFQKILSSPPEKIDPPATKNSKSVSPPFLLTLKFFSPPPPYPAERGGGHCEWCITGSMWCFVKRLVICISQYEVFMNCILAENTFHESGRVKRTKGSGFKTCK